MEVLLNLNRIIKVGEEPKPSVAKKGMDDEIPDIVLRLLSASSEVDNDDLEGREGYSRYLNDKYK